MRDRDLQLLKEVTGFLVLAGEGPVGFVERVVTDPGGRPLALAIRAGHFESRVFEVPVEVVDSVEPGGRRVLLGTGWAGG